MEKIFQALGITMMGILVMSVALGIIILIIPKTKLELMIRLIHELRSYGLDKESKPPEAIKKN